MITKNGGTKIKKISMKGYLGETIVGVENTPFKDYDKSDWALYFIERYGQIDGDHHKLWVLDQVARLLNGTDVVICLAKWDNGQFEYRVTLDDPSGDYIEWVEKSRGKIDANGDYEYDYDVGIAP